MVEAGAVVATGTEVPDGTLVAGVPACVQRTLTEQERAELRLMAEACVKLSAEYKAGGFPNAAQPSAT